jgi:hypothetical protein
MRVPLVAGPNHVDMPMQPAALAALSDIYARLGPIP